MVNSFDTLLAVFPEPLRRALCELPPDVKESVQEIRLRAGQAVSVSVGGCEQYIRGDGAFTEFAGGALHCHVSWLGGIVDRVCEHSLYAHWEELRQGFLPAPEGCRIGVAGTAVVENGRITGYRHITSLCVRIARDHTGCARDLARELCDNGVHGALICGEPSSGKTSLLRDLVREFAARHLSVAVVDERLELTGGYPVPCDVLRGAPKAEGIEQAVRCLAPRVIVFDELGDTAELHAVHTALTCGVPVVASVHCTSPAVLLQREGMRDLLYSGAFSKLVLLHGASAPGTVKQTWETEMWLREMDRHTVDLSGRRGLGRGGRT